jgi:hypothetical protein
MSSVKCETDIQSDLDRNEPTLTIALFRIVQESLTNVAKYAKAGKVTVTLRRTPEGLSLRVLDDGVGIPEGAMVKPKSHGLLGMRERALLLGGTLTVRRGRNDKGTCVEARIPLPKGAKPGFDGNSPDQGSGTDQGFGPVLDPMVEQLRGMRSGQEVGQRGGHGGVDDQGRMHGETRGRIQGIMQSPTQGPARSPSERPGQARPEIANVRTGLPPALSSVLRQRANDHIPS